MELKKLLRPTLGKIILCFSFFILFQVVDFKLGIREGVGFPFKFFALSLPFLASGFLKYHFIIPDLLFFYLIAIIFFYSKTGKVIAIIFLLITFFIIDKPLRGYNFSKSPEQIRQELKQQCEARGQYWIDGQGNELGACK
ncbi:MAG: hypothetical protein HY764_01090 [Candidatus Portnoybacteria bacterium]|nr:hypothetical protein [Candidatus Portnoybacteria bacterium]